MVVDLYVCIYDININLFGFNDDNNVMLSLHQKWWLSCCVWRSRCQSLSLKDNTKCHGYSMELMMIAFKQSLYWWYLSRSFIKPLQIEVKTSLKRSVKSMLNLARDHNFSELWNRGSVKARLIYVEWFVSLNLLHKKDTSNKKFRLVV